jgi:hypothetical protein
MTKPEGRVYGLGAQFKNAQELYVAAQKAHAAGFIRWDVYSPFPIHGMDAAMGLGRSCVSTFSLVGGCIGFCVAFILVYYTGYIDYPLTVQGKPYFAFEPTFPVFFELTILHTALFTISGMFILNLLPRLNHPVFNWDLFKKVTSDGFFVVIEAIDPKFDEDGTAKFLEELGGTDITVIREDAE